MLSWLVLETTMAKLSLQSRGTVVATHSVYSCTHTYSYAAYSSACFRVENQSKLSEPNVMPKNLVVIDTDCGIDDAVAILYAFNNPEWQVLAITCCSGNTQLNNVTSNVLRLLNFCGKDTVSVYGGCSTSLLALPLEAHHYHGDDGFGGVALEFPTGDLKLEDEHASYTLARLARDHPKAVTVIALGPLTNLALAQRIDPEFFGNLKQLTIMGGNTQGHGNIAIAAEFNFACDPEAAHVVLTEAPGRCPVRVVPWETCLDTYVPWDTVTDYLKYKNEKCHLVSRLYNSAIHHQLASGRRGFVCCDFIAMVALLKPESVVSEQPHPVHVELQGKYTRGMMVIERRSRFLNDASHNKQGHALIVTNMDSNLVTKEFCTLLTE